MYSCPPFLYRYRSMSTPAARERAREIIVESQLYCAALHTFDDPFEARFISLPDPTFADRYRSSLANEFSACCFSEPADHGLLWSLYAEGHSGICIEFSATHPHSPLVDAQRVDCDDVLPVVDFRLGSPEDRARLVHLRKATMWRHQAEWRLLGPTPPGPAQIDPAIVTSVILGCRATAETEAYVRDWIAARGLACRLRRAIMVRNRYALRICAIEAPAA